MKPDTRPACPRCGGLEFMLTRLSGGGQAHICAACHWPRKGDSMLLSAYCPPATEEK